MSSNVIIGTAGHVDHGKTTLIKALTRIDTDRLKEEKERGISIDLGFAHLRLPDGRTVGIVDVPGHERYIKNMLAGAGNVDVAMLVIAADEGIRPQTREHLDILRFLKVQTGLTVITKTDLVDQEWLELVTEDIKLYLQDSFLARQPIIPVSAVTGEGLTELISRLNELTGSLGEKDLNNPARLPIDRVFSVPGFGTVVTGTLISGEILVDQLLELLPAGRKVRVRQIQVFGEKREKGEAGQRVALNLAGLGVEEVRRGMVLSEPGKFKPADLLDLRLELLAGINKGVANRSRVRFYHGTTELLGRLTLLERDELAPGESGLAQIILEQPITAAKGDRFVIRTYSPQTTVGGGIIINPNPLKRYRRKREAIIQQLLSQEKGAPLDLVLEQLLQAELDNLTKEKLIFNTHLNALQLEETLLQLENNELVGRIAAGQSYFYLHEKRYQRILAELTEQLNNYHRKQPLGKGLRKEQLKSVLSEPLSWKLFDRLLELYEVKQKISLNGPFVAKWNYVPSLTPGEEEIKNRLLRLFYQAGFQPPDPAVYSGQAEKEILNYLIEQGELIKLEAGLIFHQERLEQAKQMVADVLKKEGEITLGELRDLLKTSRKYALPLAEYLDELKITKRVGDKRVAFLSP